MSQIRLFFLEPMINQFSKKRRTVFSDNNKKNTFFLLVQSWFCRWIVSTLFGTCQYMQKLILLYFPLVSPVSHLFFFSSFFSLGSRAGPRERSSNISDRSRPSDKGGGGGGGGGLKNNFFSALGASVWSQKKGEPGSAGPSPGYRRGSPTCRSLRICFWSLIGIFFTSFRYTTKYTKPSDYMAYAIILNEFPTTSSIVLGEPITTKNTVVTMLGVEKDLKWSPSSEKGGIEIFIPPYFQLPCSYAWVFKLENVV